MRVFLFIILAVLTLNTNLSQCLAQEITNELHLKHDGILHLYAYHTDEFLEIRYQRDNGEWQEESLKKINHLLRSRGDNKVTSLDKRLIVLADHLQDHFGADTIEVISGYRSPEFNKSLKESGHHVADESYHTKGMAMDIHIDEISESTLRDYLLSLRLGGVGYYGDRLMVHMDFGPIREWQGGRYRENTAIGIFNPQNPMTLRTDRLFYGPNSSMALSHSGLGGVCDTLTLQKFYRGKFVGVGSVVMTGIREIKSLMGMAKTQGPFGKFRFRCEKGDDWQNSNEFYIKRGDLE